MIDIVIDTLKYTLVDIKHAFTFRVFKAKWRKLNKHNLTLPGNEFPIEKVHVGKGSYGTLNVVSYENPYEKLDIGNYCSIAGNTIFLLSGQHSMKTLSTYPFKRIILNGPSESGCKGPIIIKDDVWIGYRSIILSGVTIGQGAVIAAGSVVTKNVEPYSVVGGVPAREICRRFDNKTIEKLMKISYEKYNEEFIKSNIKSFTIPLDQVADLDAYLARLLTHE